MGPLHILPLHEKLHVVLTSGELNLPVFRKIYELLPLLDSNCNGVPSFWLLGFLSQLGNILGGWKFT
jgi:hypothetical protein